MSNYNKKNLIVTLANASFVNQAKQLFSSVYFNSGWQGDYLLLANDLSEEDLNWFESRGIIIYKCPLFSDSGAGVRIHPPIILSKLFIFKEYFKKWQKIIFLDADIIVKASLNNLLELDGFNAPIALTFCLKDEFISDQQKIKDKLSQYNLRGKAFNTGIFTFDTNIIDAQTFNNLVLLYNKIKDVCLFGDESILNIFFYKKWHLLPTNYNSSPWFMNETYGLKNKKFFSYIIHFFCDKIKPWNEKSEYYSEWLDNLKQAETIDLANRFEAVKAWSKERLFFYLIYLKFRELVRLADKNIGCFGLMIKKILPKLYQLINLKRFFKSRL